MRPTFKLIPDFIIPHLERQTYGRHLIWEDKTKGSFKVSRIHQSSELWSDECIAVYKAWSLKKKLWKPDDDKNITKAKHRLITALRRSPVIEVLSKEPAYYRFRFIHPNASAKKSIDSSAEISGPLVELESNTDFDNDKNSPTIIHGIQTKVKEVYITVINNTASSETKLNLPSYELENEFKNEGFSTPNLSGEVFPNLQNFGDNTWYSGECCCDILLDSTLLHNERCIWHGIYS
ncbi:IRF tryptophan pentad repeat domain-containing protein [Trichonephila inaurata madagascariensis]|uniref:IRF tryptophan pentad repeat domain-containing protein n=1 Tax=Trichonephila inaurata madagascariensis TaxID=2747483 RepID=A0A8X7C6H4_9ARAC|nr:IRF tryptophan pentad repeat domain-containing protein [Trichonephila inaurata madagascariensis]